MFDPTKIQHVYIACGYTDLDPCRYLTWLMRKALKLDLGVTEQIARLLPVNAPEECRMIKGV